MSDGIVEATRPGADEEFGFARVEKVLAGAEGARQRRPSGTSSSPNGAPSPEGTSRWTTGRSSSFGRGAFPA